VQRQKQLVREQFRRKLRHKPPAERATDSAALCGRLLGSSLWEETRTVLFFAPLTDEPDIWPAFEFILRQGLTTALPRMELSQGRYVSCVVRDPARDLVTGHYGIKEPGPHCQEHPVNLLDLVLVPGVAFDLGGRRLGRGAGYYDRLLSAVRGTTCGIAFDEQISGELPVEPHDVFVDCILTPTRWLQC
jgi:5-formyltetrahydrofolate cyclo-ligase